MSTLFCDIETRSTCDLEIAGAWRYAADPTTEIFCVGFAVDDDKPGIWTPDAPVPAEFAAAANDPDWSIVAHNAQFERAIATRILTPRHAWPAIPIARFRCTMTQALACALPGALESVAAILELPAKDAEGARLMKRMARPRRRRKCEDPDRVYWVDGPDLRVRLARYCLQDVELTRAIFRCLPALSAAELELFALDAAINERGFAVDVGLAIAARSMARAEREAINAELSALTGGTITSIDQVQRITAFVRDHGHRLQSLAKRSVAAVLAHDPGSKVERLLELRQHGARASARKLDRLLASVDSDGRLRGTLRFHGAATGRWSGRGFQPQNLKKAKTENIAAAVDAILAGDLEQVRGLGAPLMLAGEISRSIICAPAGRVLVGADFSAIESRVLAWLAGETWKLETYRAYDRTQDPTLEPYCVAASKVLRRPVTPDDTAGRELGKIFDLSFGYGGGLGAWRRFDASDTHSDAAVERFKTDWRRAHAATVKFWHALERAAHRAVQTGWQVELNDRFSFRMENGTLFLRLPSGRRLAYPEARVVPGKFEHTRQLRFKDNARGAWVDRDAWYGTLTENVVQAIARDLLAAAIQRLEAAGYPVVLHVHDEAVAEIAEGQRVEPFLQLMLELPDWAAGLPIAAKPWSGQRYGKTAAPAPALHEPAAPVEPASSAAHDHESDELEHDGDEHCVIPLRDLIGEPLIDGKVRCPFHEGDSTPSCHVYDDHFHCFACDAHGDHLDWLMQVEGLTEAAALEHLANWDGPVAPARAPAEDDTLIRALQLWDQAKPITGTPVIDYFTQRGIDVQALPPDVDQVLRFHARCPFGPGTSASCLLVLLRDIATDAPAGIHRIALPPAWAPGVKVERKLLGRWAAPRAAKLWPAASSLVVGEGLETVLAAATRVTYRGALLQPAWAAISAGAIGRFPVVPGVHRLIILVDNDPIGQADATHCVMRWSRAGHSAVKLTPKRRGADFNDLILPESVS